MKTLNNYITEGQNKDCRYFDAFKNKFVDGTRDDMKAYQAQYRAECPKHWGPASKEADPENLLKGATHTWGSERTNEDLWVAFDKNHADYHFDSCKAVAAVQKAEGGYESWKAFKEKYPMKDYYVISGCVREVKEGEGKATVFDMYLS